MSISPWVLRDVMGHHHHPHRHGPVSLLDQNFGLGLHHDDLLQGTLAGLNSGYLRPWRHLAGRHSGTSNVTLDKDGFKVNLDVQQFRPEEVSVKVADNYVVVEGNHEERLDEHGFITRQFKRRYILPKEIECEAITSTLSTDGVLTITAPPKKPIALTDQNERVVPIVHTQAPAAIQHLANGSFAVDKDATK